MIKIVDGSLNKFLLIETLMTITKKNRTNMLINKSSGKCSDLKQSIKKIQQLFYCHTKTKISKIFRFMSLNNVIFIFHEVTWHIKKK